MTLALHAFHWPTSGWATAGITLAYTIFSGFALRAIKTQNRTATAAANAAMDAASAAKANAEALVAAERAWVAVTMEGHSAATPPDNLGPYHSLWLTSLGRTPAKITNVQYAEEFASSIETMAPWNLESQELRTPLLLAPGERYQIPGDSFYLGDTGERVKAVTSNREKWVIHGRVQYTDTFGKEHETRFCFAFNTRLRLLTPNGPASHTRYT